MNWTSRLGSIVVSGVLVLLLVWLSGSAAARPASRAAVVNQLVGTWNYRDSGPTVSVSCASGSMSSSGVCAAAVAKLLVDFRYTGSECTHLQTTPGSWWFIDSSLSATKWGGTAGLMNSDVPVETSYTSGQCRAIGAGPAIWELASTSSRWQLTVCWGAPGRTSTPYCEAGGAFWRPKEAAPTAADTVPPRVQALLSNGKAGTKVKLRYKASDNNRQTANSISVYRDGGKRIWRWTSKIDTVKPSKIYYVLWPAPRALRGKPLMFCVAARDAAGNVSDESCARIILK